MNFKKKVMDQGVKWMSDPRFVKVLSSAALMSAVMKGFELRGKAVHAFEDMVKSVVQSLDLATREEMDALKSTIAKLEAEIMSLQTEWQKGNGQAASASKKPSKV